MMRLVILMTLWALAYPAYSCECNGPVLDDEVAREAKSVFVFYLESARLIQVPIDPKTRVSRLMSGGTVKPDGLVRGSIHVVRSLKGNGTKFKKIEYDTGTCCGRRFDFGQFYVAFSADEGPTLVVNQGNVLHPGIEGAYADIDEVIAKVRVLLDGGPGLPQEMYDNSWVRFTMLLPTFDMIRRRCSEGITPK